MKSLEKNELELLQNLRVEFNKHKIQLGDLVLQKTLVVEDIQKIKKQFEDLEAGLINKYGENSVINLQTGEIKPKK